MPALSSPWFQQRNTMGTQSTAAVQERPPSIMTEAEQDEATRRLSRPTTSSMAKTSQAWKLENTFMDNGRHVWSKMELFTDCKKCMWSNDGGIKSTCKIRPLQKVDNKTTNGSA